jgi:hypothetical protein
MMQKIERYEIVDHGVDHSDYFQGCGVAYTEFDKCYTGAGRSLKEALGDALEQIGEHYDLLGCPDLLGECNESSDNDRVTQSYENIREKEPEDSQLYYYASIRVK